MALSELSGDEQGIILGQLRNALEPRLAMYFSSANKELRALLPPAAQQQLRTDYEEATALCVKVDMQGGCKELCEARRVEWEDRGLSAADLATLAKLGSVLPALEDLILNESSAGPGGVQRLADGLIAGALPGVTDLVILNMHMGEAGASALAAALDRGALPQLKILALVNAAIGDAALAALAPALRRRPALEELYFNGNPFGDEGLAALVAPPPPASTPPPPPAALKKLEKLDIRVTEVTAAGCATLVAALDSGALPALDMLELDRTPASDEAKAAVREALARLSPATALCLKVGMQSCKELLEAEMVVWDDKGLTAADLATLAKLGSVLTALEGLWLTEESGSAGPDGVQQLADGLVAGALPAVSHLWFDGMHVGDAGASALAAALDRGALPQLEVLSLVNAGIGDAALAALAPALRRRPALEHLCFYVNPFGDEGLAALVAPQPAAGAPPPPAGGLKKLKELCLCRTKVSEAGCATIVAALDSDTLPALELLELDDGIPASGAAMEAVREAMARLPSLEKLNLDDLPASNEATAAV